MSSSFTSAVAETLELTGLVQGSVVQRGGGTPHLLAGQPAYMVGPPGSTHPLHLDLRLQRLQGPARVRRPPGGGGQAGRDAHSCRLAVPG
jgi:hypothetical protein